MSFNFDTLDLSTMEIRGAKVGISNSRDTGPLLTQGPFTPPSNIVASTSYFTSGNSLVNTDTSALVVGDRIKSNTEGVIRSIIEILPGGGALKMDDVFVGTTGYDDSTIYLGAREYLVSPDLFLNQFSTFGGDGVASFVLGSTDVYGTGTSWSGQLDPTDVIRSDDDKVFYEIDTVDSASHLVLKKPYTGTPVSGGSYTAKKRKIGKMTFQYTKQDFEFSQEKGRWVANTITDSNLPTSLESYVPLADGINLKFNSSFNPDNPDMVVYGDFVGKVLSSKTARELYEFALPTVPIPESSLELHINGQIKVLGEDYVINYHQDPMYLPPPPDEEKTVANLLFLAEASNQTLVSSTTGGEGSIPFVEIQGDQTEVLSGLLPSSETLFVDGAPQGLYTDYIINSSTGLIDFVDTTENEPLVKYIFSDIGGLIKDGFQIFRNGFEEKVSFPPQDDETLVFEPDEGLIHFDEPLAPEEEALICYQVGASPQTSEEVVGEGDGIHFNLKIYPLQDFSLILSKDSTGGLVVLEENVDFRVGKQFGRITLFEPLLSGEGLLADYTPLSKQVNELQFLNGEQYVRPVRQQVFKTGKTSYTVIDPSITTLVGPETEMSSLTEETARVFQITQMTETGAIDYDMSGATYSGKTIYVNDPLQPESIEGDFRIEYQFKRDFISFPPVLPNRFYLPEDGTAFSLERVDATSLFLEGSIAKVVTTINSDEYFFKVKESSFDGTDTLVSFVSEFPTDIVNPSMAISDASVGFLPVSQTPDSIGVGTSKIRIPGPNLTRDFRPNTLINIEESIHSIASAVFEDGTNILSIKPEVFKQPSDAASLSRSDVPLYTVGDTELSTYTEIIDEPPQPGLFISYTGPGTAEVFTDSSSLHILEDIQGDQTDHQFFFNQPISEMSLLIDATSGLNSTSLVTDWTSSKIVPFEPIAVGGDSTVQVNVDTALRLNGSNTNDFSIEAGQVLLDSSLVFGQRYNLDYQGRRSFSEGSQITGTSRYFTSLPAGAEIKASFDYANSDQWYIQVLSQQNYLDTVLLPRLEEESAQASQQVGQGIDVSPEISGNDQGLVDIFHRERDTEIECRIWNKIFDFYNNRLQDMADELEAGSGPVLCNNDGLLSESDQSNATKPINRMFPKGYYNELPPKPLPCLTGRIDGPGNAEFNAGSTTVAGYGTTWDKHLKSGDFIKPNWDSTSLFKINTVAPTSLTLYNPYEGDYYSGPFFALSRIPLFDDDGFTGAKLLGTVGEDFGLVDNDLFNVRVNASVDSTHKFEDYDFPFNLILGLDTLNVNQVSSSLADMRAQGVYSSVAPIYPEEEVVGYRDVVSIYVDNASGKMEMLTGAAVPKLGFVPGDISTGSLSVDSEVVLDEQEKVLVPSEVPHIDELLSWTNKLSRYTDSTADIIRGIIGQERALLVNTIGQIGKQISAAQEILLEGSSDFSDTSTETAAALVEHEAFKVLSEFAYGFADTILGVDATAWTIDYTPATQYLVATGDSTFKLGVPKPTQPDPPLNFFPSRTDSDYRILNAGTTTPVGTGFLDVYYTSGPETGSLVPGSFPSWQFIPYGYSSDSTVTFDLDSTTLFGIHIDSTHFSLVPTYAVTSTYLSLDWSVGGSPGNATFLYSSFPTVGALKTAIETITGIYTDSYTGNDSTAYGSLVMGAGVITQTTELGEPFAQGLKGDVQVNYATISDRNLLERSSYDSTRATDLQNRVNYLLGARSPEILEAIKREEFLNTDEGDYGNLYTYSNIRFHRRDGCEARLKAIQAQADADKQRVEINNRIIREVN